MRSLYISRLPLLSFQVFRGLPGCFSGPEGLPGAGPALAPDAFFSLLRPRGARGAWTLLKSASAGSSAPGPSRPGGPFYRRVAPPRVLATRVEMQGCRWSERTHLSRRWSCAADHGEAERSGGIDLYHAFPPSIFSLASLADCQDALTNVNTSTAGALYPRSGAVSRDESEDAVGGSFGPRSRATKTA
jgi:hypothetical protein